jgi:hypothetical protein
MDIMKKLLSSLFVVSCFFGTVSQAQDLPSVVQAREAGFTTCLKMFKVASERVLKGSGHTSHGVWQGENPDKNLFTAFSVKQYADGDSHISVVAGQSEKGDCFSESRETIFIPSPCQELRDSIKDKSKETVFGENSILATLAAGGPYMYLTPLQGGKACLYTMRTVVFK